MEIRITEENTGVEKEGKQGKQDGTKVGWGDKTGNKARVGRC